MARRAPGGVDLARAGGLFTVRLDEADGLGQGSDHDRPAGRVDTADVLDAPGLTRPVRAMGPVSIASPGQSRNQPTYSPTAAHGHPTTQQPCETSHLAVFAVELKSRQDKPGRPPSLRLNYSARWSVSSVDGRGLRGPRYL
jgi:hypothetical protein